MTITTVPADIHGLIFGCLELHDLGRLAQCCKFLRSYLIKNHPKYSTVFSSVKHLNERKYVIQKYSSESAHFKFFINENQFLLPSGALRVNSPYRGYVYSDFSSCVLGKIIEVKDKKIELFYIPEILSISDSNHLKVTFKGVRDIAFFGNRLFIAKEQGLMALDIDTLHTTVFASLKYTRLSSDLASGLLYGLPDFNSPVDVIDFANKEARTFISDNPFIDKVLEGAKSVTFSAVTAILAFSNPIGLAFLGGLFVALVVIGIQLSFFYPSSNGW